MGATIRIYAESFERDPERHNRETQVQAASVGNKSKTTQACSATVGYQFFIYIKHKQEGSCFC